MSDAGFRELLQMKWDEGKFVCIGLDPEYKNIPAGVIGEDIDTRLVNFICPIIETTVSIAGMIKPNVSFYIRYGWRGVKALEEIYRFAARKAPDVVRTSDMKNGDIGKTNLGYVEFARDILGAHAVTLHNYMGLEAMKPFLESGLGCFVLCRTSNPGADEFQKLPVWEDVEFHHGTHPHFEEVAWNVGHEWAEFGNVGAVAGASPTSIDDLAVVRQKLGDKPILCPGVDSQGGKAAEAYKLGRDSEGRGISINSSGGITHAHLKPEYEGLHWAEAAARSANRLHDEIVQVMEEVHAD